MVFSGVLWEFLSGAILLPLLQLGEEALPPIGERVGPELDSPRAADLASVLSTVEPGYTVDEQSGDVHSFLQFLVSLRAAARDSLHNGRHLLFVAPDLQVVECWFWVHDQRF